MKKTFNIFCVIMCVCFIFNATGTTVFSDSNHGHDFDNTIIGYYPTNITSNKNGTKLEGYFYNLNKDYHVANINSFSITLIDNNGTTVFEWTLKDGGNLQNITLPGYGLCGFNFTNSKTISLSKYDLSCYYTYITCQFDYGLCSGLKSCSICKERVNVAPSVLDQTPIISKTAPKETKETKVVPEEKKPAVSTPTGRYVEVKDPCIYGSDGKKLCTTCGGDGKIEVLADSIYGSGCRTCTSSGRMLCIYCGGKGYTSRYVWKDY